MLALVAATISEVGFMFVLHFYFSEVLCHDFMHNFLLVNNVLREGVRDGATCLTPIPGLSLTPRATARPPAPLCCLALGCQLYETIFLVELLRAPLYIL